jgi:hypothetical protein
MSAKLVPTFADKGCRVVSVAGPYSRNLTQRGIRWESAEQTSLVGLGPQTDFCKYGNEHACSKNKKRDREFIEQLGYC